VRSEDALHKESYEVPGLSDMREDTPLPLASSTPRHEVILERAGLLLVWPGG